MDKSHKYLQLAALIAGFVIPCAMMAGYVYHLGYTFTFGLNSELISKDFSDVVAESWILGVQLLVYVITHWAYLLLLGLAFIVFVFLLMHLVTYLQDHRGFKLNNDEITQENQGQVYWGLSKWKWICLWGFIEEVTKWIAGPLSVVVFVTLMMMLPYQKGQDFAQRQITEYQKDGCASSTHCVQLIDFSGTEEQLVVEGIMVSANDQRIAVFSGEKLVVYPLLESYKLSRRYVAPDKSETE